MSEASHPVLEVLHEPYYFLLDAEWPALLHKQEYMFHNKKQNKSINKTLFYEIELQI